MSEKENASEKNTPPIENESENINKKSDETGADSATIPPVDDVAERVAAFNAGLKTLLGKYELALGAEARIDNGRVVADPKVLDARTLPKK